jgi:glycosyltransferase involved in cell wall biosynthesis
LNSLVSICLATYNGERYLKEQLDSIVKQSYKNIEVIAQDDCSSDKTLEILKSYEDKLKITIYQNEQNLGYIKNFESVLKKANGEFISICDQDDIWQENKIELLMSNIKDNTLIYSDSLLVDENANSLGKKFSQSLKNNFISTKNPLAFLNDNCVSAHAMLFKKELLEYIFPFPANIFFDAWIAANAASLDGIKFYDECLVYYRQHSTNTLSKHNKDSKDKPKAKLSKADKKLQKVQAKIGAIKSMLKLPLLKEDDKTTLQALKNEYLKFQDSYINFTIFNILYTNKEKLYEITKKNPLRLSLKEIIGYKAYKALPIL